MRRLVMWLVVGSIVASCVFATGGTAEAVPVSTQTYLTVNSVFRPLPDGSWSRRWGADVLHVTMLDRGIDAVHGGLDIDDEDWVRLTLRSPLGEPFAVGDQLATITSPYGPGAQLDFSVGRSSVCQAATGRFEVRSVSFAGDGTITRALVTYEVACPGEPPSFWGEFGFNVPVTGPLAVSPQVLRFTETNRERGRVAPVWVTNVGARGAAVGTPTVTGPDAGDFTVADDVCAGRTLRPGHTCPVQLGFDPSTAGPRTARLRLAGSTVELRGDGEPGVSGWRTEETDGAVWVGGPWIHELEPEEWTFVGRRLGEDVWLVANHPTQGRWTARFGTGDGQPLTPGTYQRDAWNDDDGAVIDISSPGRGCSDKGTFTIHQLSWRADDQVDAIDVTFDHQCDTYTQYPGTLHGTIQFRARTDAKAPQPMRDLRVRRPASGPELRWTASTSPDVARWIVTAFTGAEAPALPSSGRVIGVGTGTSVGLAGLPAGEWSFAVFPVDRTGNVGPAVAVTTTLP